MRQYIRPWRREGKINDTIAALLRYEYNPVQDTEDYGVRAESLQLHPTL